MLNGNKVELVAEIFRQHHELHVACWRTGSTDGFLLTGGGLGALSIRKGVEKHRERPSSSCS